jgi:hypothetical protein
LALTPQDLRNLEFEHFRLLPTGEWAGVREFIFTYGLLIGIDQDTYRTRFCYGSEEEALAALASWDGTLDPPGRWLKEKGWAGERQHPARFKGIAIAIE